MTITCRYKCLHTWQIRSSARTGMRAGVIMFVDVQLLGHFGFGGRWPNKVLLEEVVKNLYSHGLYRYGYSRWLHSHGLYSFLPYQLVMAQTVMVYSHGMHRSLRMAYIGMAV